MDINELKNFVKDLPLEQLNNLVTYIHEIISHSQDTGTPNEINAYNRTSCPNCESAYFVKNGKVLEKQRFLCKSCNKHSDTEPIP